MQLKKHDKLYMTHWRFMRSEHLNGRGVMCQEWYDDFYKFREWALGNGYKYDDPKFMYTLQRKDKNEPFCPENCFFRQKGKKNIELIEKEKTLFTEERKDEICQRYINSLISTRELAKENGVCQRTIMNILSKRGITAKDRKTKVEDLENEVWKIVPGFGDKYSVSNMGRVKSSNYKGSGGESLMFPNIQNGYEIVAFHYEGNDKFFRVHRLVAELFIPNPNNYDVVNHKNEIRNDNRAENLEWCDLDYNTKYSCGHSVIAENIITGEVRKYLSIQSTKEDGFNPSLVCKCCKGIRVTHGGFTWKYENEEA